MLRSQVELRDRSGFVYTQLHYRLLLSCFYRQHKQYYYFLCSFCIDFDYAIWRILIIITADAVYVYPECVFDATRREEESLVDGNCGRKSTVFSCFFSCRAFTSTFYVIHSQTYIAAHSHLRTISQFPSSRTTFSAIIISSHVF